MLDRYITNITLDCSVAGGYYAIQVTTRYCESDMSGGRIKRDVARYEMLTEDEARDVILAVSDGALPGSRMVDDEPMLVFTIT